MHAVQLAPVELPVDIGIGTGPDEHRVVVGQQFVELDIAADLHAEMETHAHAFQHHAPRAHHVLVKLERRNAEGEQAADLVLAVEHIGTDARASQAIRTGKPRGTRADDGDAHAGLAHARKIGAPALADGLVGDPALHAADRHRTEIALLQRACAFAEAILWAYAAADFRQRIGFVHQGGGLEQTAILHQLQPVRDVVVHGAGMLAVRIAAIDTALRLRGGFRGGEFTGDLAVAEHTNRDRHGARRLPRNLEEAEILRAHAALRSSSASASRLAALGFTSQKRCNSPRKSPSTRRPQALSVSSAWRAMS